MGCNSPGKEHTDSGQQVPTGDASTSVPVRDWYKQYAGTVAGQPVQVQLHKYGNELHGAYYYTAKGQILNLLPEPGTGDSLKFSEKTTTEETNWESAGGWRVIVKGDSLTGEWANGQRKKIHPIRLKEIQPAGSIELDIAYLDDSAKLNEQQKDYTAFTSYQAVVPKATGYPHKAFVDSVLSGAIGCKVGDVQSCMRGMADKYFREYKEEVKDLDTNYNIHREERLNTWVLFNSDGWLILESFTFSYTGGAHGNYGSNFLNIDLQRGKIWKLNDVIAGDTARLRPLLTEAARKYFRLKPGEKLGDRLLQLDAPTVAGNFYITPRGLTFVYSPYEIASYAQGSISLFIPYEKLYGMLTPEFSARMNKK
jgi:hypothetical protein